MALAIQDDLPVACRRQMGHNRIGFGIMSGHRVQGVPWSFMDTLQAVTLVAVGTFLLVFVSELIRRGRPVDETLAANTLTMFLIPCILISSAWIFGVRRHMVAWETLGFVRPKARFSYSLSWVVLLLSLAFAAIYATTIEALGIDLLVPPVIPAGTLGEGIYRNINTITVGILGPIAEETFFRGFLTAGIVPYIGIKKAIIATSALFAVSHLQPGLLIPFFVSGLLLSWLYIRSGSIWPSITAHSAQNLFVLALTP